MLCYNSFMITIKKLNNETFEDYCMYLQEALDTSTENFLMVDKVDKTELQKSLNDPLFAQKTSLLAYVDGKIVGRIEYHFYTCFQDHHKVCYVDWLYTLPAYRKKSVATTLFAEMENHCKENDINFYYLIRANNEGAQKFYQSQNTTEKPAVLVRKVFKD